SKVTLRPKVRRPMAWDSTKSAPSGQQPEPSTQCRIPGGYRRAETRHHRIHHRDLVRTARRNQTHRGRYSTRFVERIRINSLYQGRCCMGQIIVVGGSASLAVGWSNSLSVGEKSRNRKSDRRKP